MKKIKLLFLKFRLLWTTVGAQVAEKIMNKVINSTKAAEDEMDFCYENFIRRAKQQAKAQVEYLREIGRPDGNPQIDVDLGVEHYIVKPDLAGKITRFDMETALTRHRYGDWGDVTNFSWVINNSYAKNRCGTIRSRYSINDNEHFIVKTDMDSRRTEMFMEAA